MTTKELSKLFNDKGWDWDVGDEVRPPTPGEIETMFDILCELLERANDIHAIASLGRFVLYTDPELPNDWGIYLELGYIPKNRGVDG